MSQETSGARRLLFAALLLLSCGGTNTLGGSVEDLFPLDVSNVEIRRNEQALQISYFANRNDGNLDLVARIIVDTVGQNVTPDSTIRLEGDYAAGHARTTVVHLAAGEPERVLPEVDRGDLHIDQGGPIGEVMSGDFSMSFQQGDYGGGRNLYGNFKSVVLDGGFGPDPGQVP
jgi:hypothetical protein